MIDAVFHVARDPGNVLVRKRAEHGMGFGEVAHPVEVSRQHGRRVRIVGNVEHDRRLAGQHLKARR